MWGRWETELGLLRSWDRTQSNMLCPPSPNYLFQEIEFICPRASWSALFHFTEERRKLRRGGAAPRFEEMIETATSGSEPHPFGPTALLFRLHRAHCAKKGRVYLPQRSPRRDRQTESPPSVTWTGASGQAGGGLARRPAAPPGRPGHPRTGSGSAWEQAARRHPARQSVFQESDKPW